jgi:hypothetical protein
MTYTEFTGIYEFWSHFRRVFCRSFGVKNIFIEFGDSSVEQWIKDSTHIYYHNLKDIQLLIFKFVRTCMHRLHVCHQVLSHWLLRLLASQCIWYRRRLHLWPLLIDCLLLDFIQHYRKKCRVFVLGDREDKLAVHLFLSIFLHRIRSTFSLTLCRNSEVLHHVVAKFVFGLQEAHSLNALVTHFPQNFWIAELVNVPR